MARGKVQLKRIENPVHRQVTFCKRRAGLLKKAKELSVLCDAEIALFIFSAHGKLTELATKGTMQGLIERYMKFTRGALPEAPPQPLLLRSNINEMVFWYLFGVGNKTSTMDELEVLEKNLETWIYHIRSMKTNIMLQEIEALKDKEGTLTEANKYLHAKIVENSAIHNFVQFATDASYPLIIQDGSFQLY
ncbi:hypothetical protein ACSQ67_021931 [Phaseolus vulgaris]